MSRKESIVTEPEPQSKREDREPVEVSSKEPVEVSSLEPGASFTLNGKPYIVSAVYPFGVMAVPPKPTPRRKLVEKIPPDTLVKPV